MVCVSPNLLVVLYASCDTSHFYRPAGIECRALQLGGIVPSCQMPLQTKGGTRPNQPGRPCSSVVRPSVRLVRRLYPGLARKHI